MINKPRVQIPEDLAKREVKLFGLAGWFSQPPTVECAAFGGYFRYDPLDNRIIDGQLVDIFGQSDISGFMKENYLGFAKRYSGEISIAYEFEKKNDIWVGNYAGVSVGEGRAQCVTFLADGDAFTIASGSSRPAKKDDVLL